MIQYAHFETMSFHLEVADCLGEKKDFRIIFENFAREGSCADEHKETHTVAGFEYIVQSSAADRPAFSIIESRHGEKNEVCHFYSSMGLKKQHPHVQTCLARLYDSDFSLYSPACFPIDTDARCFL